jgi:nucleoside-diphosphate-sugar epimerase
MMFLVGSRGRLGRAIARHYSASELTSLDRGVYADWWREGAPSQIANYFADKAGSTIFVTAGVLDPGLPAAEHGRVNYDLPRHIIEGATQAGLSVITFGTVMESLIASPNPYVKSKLALGDYVAAQAAAGIAACHVRVHTQYGCGEPSPFMFLGQLLSAVRQGVLFRMTEGKQLREYHHVDDDASAIKLIVEAQARGIVELSHGDPLTLRQIATTVLDELGASQLLRIGALPEPLEENFGTLFTRSALLRDATFRDTLPAIVTYMKACVAERDFNQ